MLGLIALFSSQDHISFAGNTLKLEQQRGIVFIAASVATILIDAERQTESLEFLHQAALLSGRVQLEPNPTNRARFQFFLTLISSEIPPEGEDL